MESRSPKSGFTRRVPAIRTSRTIRTWVMSTCSIFSGTAICSRIEPIKTASLCGITLRARLWDIKSIRPACCSQPGGIYGPKGSPHTIVFRRRIPVHGKVVDASTGAAIQGFTLYEGTHFKGNPADFWEWTLETRPQLEPSGFVDSLKTLDRLIRYRVQAKGYRPQLCEPMDAAKLPNEPISLEFRLEKDNGYQALSACRTASRRPPQKSTRRPRIPATFLAS